MRQLGQCDSFVNGSKYLLQMDDQGEDRFVATFRYSGEFSPLFWTDAGRQIPYNLQGLRVYEIPTTD